MISTTISNPKYEFNTVWNSLDTFSGIRFSLSSPESVKRDSLNDTNERLP